MARSAVECSLHSFIDGPFIQDGRVVGRCLPDCCRQAHFIQYLIEKDSCHLFRQEGDVFQFGVPTQMHAIATLLQRLNVKYGTYFGFDSFRGLPEEAPGVTLPPRGQWLPGQFSDVHEMSPNFTTRVGAVTLVRQYTPKRRGASPLAVDEVVRMYERKLNTRKWRMRLIPGFYNQSLTSALAASARAAMYININCDLWRSTMEAYEWLFTHKLIRRGTVVSYDDWFEQAISGGEVRAHIDATQRWAVEWEELSLSRAWDSFDSSCHLVFFRVVSVGVRAFDAVTPRLLLRGCALGQPPCGEGHGRQVGQYHSMKRTLSRLRNGSRSTWGQAHPRRVSLLGGVRARS